MLFYLYKNILALYHSINIQYNIQLYYIYYVRRDNSSYKKEYD
jgi:hypothetical protein